jgi:hypothetical protein
MHSEPARGFGAVSSGKLQSLGDNFPFSLAQRRMIGQSARGNRRIFQDSLRKIADLNFIIGSENHGAFNRIAEFGTLPGHSYCGRSSRTSGEKPSTRRPQLLLERARKKSARRRMSSARSRSGGNLMATTFRRCHRSSRKVPAATAAFRSLISGGNHAKVRHHYRVKLP